MSFNLITFRLEIVENQKEIMLKENIFFYFELDRVLNENREQKLGAITVLPVNIL